MYLGPIPNTVNYDGDHIRLAPPAANPALPWTVACDQEHYSCGPVFGKSAVVELVSFSDMQYRYVDSLNPLYQNVLAYAVIWHGIRCAMIGPMRPPTPDPIMPCDNLLLVDANTGHGLVAYQIAVGPPTR
jgi:hypothetical protein